MKYNKISSYLERRILSFCHERGVHKWIPVTSLSCLEQKRSLEYDMIFFPFILHEAGERAGDILGEWLNLGPQIVIADYRTPERNLDYPACALFFFLESMRSHFESYRSFMKAGGIEHVLVQCKQIPEFREPVLGGAGSLICLRKPGHRNQGDFRG